MRRSKRKLRQFAMIPAAVLSDSRISTSAVRVYGALALWLFGGTTVSMGLRKMSELSSLNKDTCAASIKDLSQAGWITIIGQDEEGRSVYRLHSKIHQDDQALALEKYRPFTALDIALCAECSTAFDAELTEDFRDI